MVPLPQSNHVLPTSHLTSSTAVSADTSVQAVKPVHQVNALDLPLATILAALLTVQAPHIVPATRPSKVSAFASRPESAGPIARVQMTVPAITSACLRTQQNVLLTCAPTARRILCVQREAQQGASLCLVEAHGGKQCIPGSRQNRKLLKGFRAFQGCGNTKTPDVLTDYMISGKPLANSVF